MDKQERLKKLLEIAVEDRPSTKEVVALLSNLIKSVKETLKNTRDELKSNYSVVVKQIAKELEDKNAKDIKSLQDALEEQVEDLTDILSKEAEIVTKDWYKTLSNEVYKLEKLISEVPQFSPAQLEAKFGAVINDLENKLYLLKPNAIEVRDMLETLQDDDRLDITAVKGAVGVHVGTTPPEDKSMLWVDIR
jgi:exonuclease VII large subunit